MNVFDLAGPEFLAVYVLAMAAGVAVALAVRHVMRLPAVRPSFDELGELDTYEVAYLADGAEGATWAAVASLTRAGVLEVDPETKGRMRVGDPDRSETPLERTVADAARNTRYTTPDLDDLTRAAEACTRHLEAELQRRGMIMTAAQRLNARIAGSISLALVLGFGAVKVAVGLQRGRPVTFLLVLMFATAAVMAALIVTLKATSRRGDHAIAMLRKHHDALRRTFSRARDKTVGTAQDAALVAGLFGPALFASSPLAPVFKTLSGSFAHGGYTGSSGGFFGDGSCASSCVSSCSGCGGSCSGCGGGCGGCGGCGS